MSSVRAHGSIHFDLLWLIDLIEDTAVVEVRFLDLAPAAEYFVYGKESHFRKFLGVFFRHCRQPWAIVVLRGDFLAFRSIKIFQVGLGDGPSAAFVDNFIDDTYRRLCQNANRGHDNLDLIRAQLFNPEKSFVLPRNQNIANSPFDECRRGSAGAGVEHGNVLVEGSDELLSFRIALVGFAQLVAPGAEVIPARAAGGLGIRRDNGNSRLDQIGPITNSLGVSFADQEYDRRGVWCAVLLQTFLPVRGDEPLCRDRIDVGRKSECDDTCLEAVDHRSR